MNTTENKLTYEEQEALLVLYKKEIESLTNTNSTLTDKSNAFEIEVVEKGIEIEGLKQKNIISEGKAKTSERMHQLYYSRFMDARDKGNEAINDLETVRYWMWIREAAMAITILGFIVYHFSN